MRSNLQALAAAACFFGIAVSLPHESRSASAPAEGPTARAAVAPAARAVLSGVGIEKAETSRKSAEMSEAQNALAALSGEVGKQSHPDALRLAFEAYFNYRAEHPEKVRKPYLYFVDYGLDSREPRGYVFDMKALRVVDGPFAVAHGRGSGKKDGVPTRFSNIEGSATSSLGLFLAQETYRFSGKASGKPYSSVGLRMAGLSGRFNSAARQRRVVVHGAPYVGPGKAGRSEGCPAMDQARARKLLPKIGNGGMVFLFSPLDKSWLKNDPWAHRGTQAQANG
ncbi:MAG TPA: murein L,D-transpeptidase catalytic domain family protein [Longimicrobium sp.]|jgi:hypothetical protein